MAVPSPQPAPSWDWVGEKERKKCWSTSNLSRMLMRKRWRKDASLKREAHAPALQKTTSNKMLVVLSLQLVMLLRQSVHVCVHKWEWVSWVRYACWSTGRVLPVWEYMCSWRLCCVAQMCVGGLSGCAGRLKMHYPVSHKANKTAWTNEDKTALHVCYLNVRVAEKQVL